MRSLRPDILVIDDEVEMCEVSGTLLSRAGYKVVKAHSAIAAEAILNQYVPPLLLCDISMPGKSGLELVAEIREKGWPCAIVMVTAHSDKERILEALRLGCLDYVTKPFNWTKFIEDVGVWIEYGRTAQTLVYEQEELHPDDKKFRHLEYLRALCVLKHKK